MSAERDYRWVEVWISDTRNPPYLLVLGARPDASLELYDPYDSVTDAVTNTFSSYEEAQSYLWEDEFWQVKGREELPQ